MNYDRESIDAAHGLIVGVIVGALCWAVLLYTILTIT